MVDQHLTPFQQALLDSVLKEYADVPREEDLADPFTDRFRSWISAFLPRNRPGRVRAVKVLRRILIAAVIAALLVGTAMAIPAVREAIIDYFFHADETQIGITFDKAKAATAPNEIVTPYTITDIPNTFMLALEDIQPECVYVWFVNDGDQWITFTQLPIPEDPEELAWWSADGEDITRKSVLMGDYLVEIIEGDGNYKMVWTNNEYLFTLELPDSIGEEERNKIFASWGPKESE